MSSLRPLGRFGSLIRAGQTALANGWALILDGEWRILLYRLRMKWNRVDLAYVSISDLGSTEDRSLHHDNSGGPALDSLFKALPISPADEALDFGCGKAGAMLTMAKYPFSRVDGVEISEMLVQVARRNLSRMNIGKATIFHADAAEFTDIDRYTFFYMFQPFPRAVTKSVLDNLAQSLERRRRKVTLVYYNPVEHDLVLATGFRIENEFHHFHTGLPAYVYRAGH